MRKRLILTLIIAGVFAVSMHAEIVGKFSYKGNPQGLQGDTLVVSDTMVAMSENVRVETFMTLGDSISDTPSVFFVIDNSGSMNGTGSPATDRNGNRFTVTSAFIDTLRNSFPKVEVGVAVFDTWLFFDPNDSPSHPYFTRSPLQANGAYVPLLQLDRTYAAYGNRTGYDILKDILDTIIVGSGANQYVDLSYHPTNTALSDYYTNINAGFDAARSAFQSSLNANRRNKQFIIFLSDGDANRPSSGDDPQRFQNGDTIPTTFTVYFTTGGSGVPAAISTMTTNIRNNGYSTSNPKSTYWGYQNTGFQQLMNLLMDSVFTVIATNSLGRPTRISIGSKSEINWGVDSSFTFDNLFPLKGLTTPFTYVINYRLSKNGRMVGDTTQVINFWVRTSPGAPMDTALYDIKYWDRDMMFRYGGAPVTLITGAMPSVELRFGYSPGTADYHYTNIMVDLMNTSSAVLDREIFLLNRIGTTDSFSITFDRAISASPVSSNGILEHTSPDDTIIAVFRNSESPRLPLDTLLISCPVNIDPATLGALLESAITRDSDGDGLIDRIDLYFDKPVVIDSDSVGCFTVKYVNSPDFSVDSIIPLSASSYSLYIAEHQTSPANPVPQTGWKPIITISGLSGAENVSGFLTTDGCPPVVWRAVKQIVSEKLCDDMVSVYLSEKITGAGGLSFSISNSPDATFATWTQDSIGSFITDTTVLDSINSFVRVVNDSILVFSMNKLSGNCQDLGADNWINLQWQTPMVFDASDNAPSQNNQKVRITVEGSSLKVGIPTNPGGPSSRWKAPGVLEFKHTPDATTWVSDPNSPGGVAVQIQGLTIPEVDKDKVNGYLTVYDAVGNTVNWGSDEGIFNGYVTSRDGFVLYWNGFNHQGMAVSPGVYRMVIAIKYPRSSGIKDIKKVVKVGMRR
jgi:hypothetical protein